MLRDTGLGQHLGAFLFCGAQRLVDTDAYSRPKFRPRISTMPSTIKIR